MVNHGRHVFDAIGMTRVVVEDGKVVSVGESELEYCPLFKKFRGMETITPEMVRENIEFRIRDFGFCTENRVVRADDYITFGVSEILSTALENGRIDAAVIAADGCGTAVITDPYILQGLCGRISGLVETSPLQVVLDAVGRDNVVDPETVPVNMVKGAELADSKGYQRFSVTVCKPEDAKTIRERYGDRAIIVGVHTSHINRCGVGTMFDCCDFITACGSRWTREIAHERNALIAGNKVEILGISDAGKQMVLEKLRSIGKEPYNGEELDEPRPLIEYQSDRIRAIGLRSLVGIEPEWRTHVLIVVMCNNFYDKRDPGLDSLPDGGRQPGLQPGQGRRGEEHRHHRQ